MLQTITHDPAKEKRINPYFIWWNQDITEADVRRALASDNLYRRVTYMSYILNDAKFEDIWLFLTLKDIQKHFWQIRWRTPEVRDMWHQILMLMGYPLGEHPDPRSTRVLV